MSNNIYFVHLIFLLFAAGMFLRCMVSPFTFMSAPATSLLQNISNNPADLTSFLQIWAACLV